MKRHNLVARSTARKLSQALNDFLMFCCVSAFFVGLVVAVTTLPA
jgi:hypothetical protein